MQSLIHRCCRCFGKIGNVSSPSTPRARAPKWQMPSLSFQRWFANHSISPATEGACKSKVTILSNVSQDATPEKVLMNIEEAFENVSHIANEMQRTGRQRFSNDFIHAADSLIQCTMLLHADFPLEILLQRMMEEAKTLVGAEVCYVFLLDTERGTLYSRNNPKGPRWHVPLTKGIVGLVVRTGLSSIAENIFPGDHCNLYVDMQTGVKTKCSERSIANAKVWHIWSCTTGQQDEHRQMQTRWASYKLETISRNVSRPA